MTQGYELTPNILKGLIFKRLNDDLYSIIYVNLFWTPGAVINTDLFLSSNT